MIIGVNIACCRECVALCVVSAHIGRKMGIALLRRRFLYGTPGKSRAVLELTGEAASLHTLAEWHVNLGACPFLCHQRR